jgi:ParB family chromosome partitioning protein
VSVASGELSAGQARALLGLRDEAEMIALGRRAVHDALTVRALEEAVQNLHAEPAPPPPSRPAATAPPLAPDDEHLRRGFEQALGLPVTLQRRRTGGRLIVDFADDEDLDSLYHRLGGPKL